VAKTYSDKLKDPKWQKRRLSILNRDEWMCQKCYDNGSTLHVHHRRYSNEYKDPWDYPDNLLVTLCETCHQQETDQMNDTLKYLCDVFRERFFSEDILVIIKGLEQYSMPHMPDVCATAISHSFSDPEESQRIVDLYFEYLLAKNGSKFTAEMPF
jgi:hypothetical protein